jgi:hypothetical protein
MSGRSPTVTLLRMLPSTSRNTTVPLSVAGSAATATATRPFFTVTLLMPPPKALRSMESSPTGLLGVAQVNPLQDRLPRHHKQGLAGGIIGVDFRSVG